MRNSASFFAGLATCILVSVSTPSLANPHNVTGLYLTAERNSVVDIQACGESLCGKVVWLNAETLDEGVTPETAVSKAGENILGLTILRDFERARKDWREGTIYDPGKDKTYASRLERLDDGTLQVKGCISFFCQTQIWSPVDDLTNPLQSN